MGKAIGIKNHFSNNFVIIKLESTIEGMQHKLAESAKQMTNLKLEHQKEKNALKVGIYGKMIRF
jgi:hypothetical protein